MIEKWIGYKSCFTKELYQHYILVQNNFNENEDFLKISTPANLGQ